MIFKNRKFVAIVLLLGLLFTACGSSNTPVANNNEAQPALGAPTTNPPTQASTEDEVTVEATESTPNDGTAFKIIQSETEARFVIGEILLGSPKTVVGTAKKVTGEITADFTDTSSAQVSVSVDLSSLETDSSNRTRTLHNNILQTNIPDNKFGIFESTSIFGLPANVEVGASYKTQITGLLTVHGITEEVTFEGSITIVSETRLEGSFTLNILYETFTVIRRLPKQVASVDPDVSLEIDFVAERK